MTIRGMTENQLIHQLVLLPSFKILMTFYFLGTNLQFFDVLFSALDRFYTLCDNCMVPREHIFPTSIPLSLFIFSPFFVFWF